MATPDTRDELIDYCLRALGSPVLEINVADEQIEDRVDEGLQWFREYHPDGKRRFYIKHQITQADIDNKYIDLGQDLLTVVRMFRVDMASASTNFFDIKYQMRLNDIADLNRFSGDMAYYEQMQQHLSLLDMKLSGEPLITFERQKDRVHFYHDGKDFVIGNYVIFEVYGDLDPDTATNSPLNSLWNHKFLKSYTTALIKKQWGQNMSKFEGMQLPGGVTISGRQIYDDAKEEIEQIMTKFREEEDVGPMFFIG
jgi:hypothetical protein|tara:strand:- start:1095 stop:1856 length:762 start_codon:yes stop_codon:yes gene_type:complete